MSSENGIAKTKLIDRPEWLDVEFFPYQNRQIEVSGHLIHYIDEGQGPTLLLLHGNGSWSYGFRLTIPKLTSHFRVIALDYPGMGLSKAKDGFSYLPGDHSHVVEEFVDLLGLNDIRLCVEDWGGPIGLGLAGRRPELFHSLVITNTWGWPAQGSPKLEKFSNFAGGFIGRILITQFNLLSGYAVPNTAMSRKMSNAEARAYWLPYPTSHSRIAQATFPREILGSYVYLARVEAGLRHLANKPVAIIWGEQDPGFGDTELKRWQKHFPNATTLTLPNAKHFVHVDEPEAVAAAMIELEKSGGKV